MSAVATAFWRSYLRQLPPGHPHGETEVYSVFAFDDTPAVSDKLAALVLAGRKKATASLPIQSEAEGTRLPEAGDLSIITLGDGTPVAIIETTDVRLVPFGAVDAAFAAEEGEGDLSLAWWRAAHTNFFGRVVARLGGTLDDTSVVVCERFRLLYADV
jgi:uncharacterized protein YhfF